MKLIIDIPEEDLIRTCEEPCTKLGYIVANGTPFDTVIEDIKAEIHRANCHYHGTEWGMGIELCERIVNKHISGKET